MNNLRDLLKTVRLAREVGAKPRVHGNGFIQLDLSERKRLHIWGDRRVPCQAVPSTMHDHTFSFRSTVFRGQLVHRSIYLLPLAQGAYRKYTAVTNQGDDTRLIASEKRYDAVIGREELFKEGDSYEFSARKFHETVILWPCVTVIDKDGPTLAQGGPSPNVLIPFNLEPDNTFNRYQVPTELLWQVIFDNLEVKVRA